ncbi:guanine deaminase [uncultured Kocuria sp.]|uniref:guanine deaminase n=1 Tax=uncultured Kocuria sp. TaxID=259305 RepID=UPI0025974F5C|nr:guanine deaminase [uncultured Kocuria sp.]MCT1366867.1 guanine deaminase [Rothia sp. p3-SID1597]
MNGEPTMFTTLERRRQNVSQSVTTTTKIITGHVVSPLSGADRETLDLERGAVVVCDGRILDVGEARTMIDDYPEASVESFGDRLIIPGFIDCHAHYSQMAMIASPGLQLLEWLDNFTFPAESEFADAGHCAEMADFFTTQMIAHGVTSACVYATVHPESVRALFRSAKSKNLRIMTGKVCMDRHAPEHLLDTPELAYEQSRELLEEWHGVGRLEYAITPRFAPTSSVRQLELLGQLAQEHPEAVIQTHLSENPAECAWVSELFPEEADYTAVYERFGLVRKRAVFGHATHVSDSELSRLGSGQASLAHCPTSNLFLGSGLFTLKKNAQIAGLKIGLGSDVGAGTSLSPLVSLNEAYKVSRSVGGPLDSFEALRLATLDSAEALGIEDSVGSLEAGKDADVVILDPETNPVLRMRASHAKTTAELLFATMMLGDDRTIHGVYVAGSKTR